MLARAEAKVPGGDFRFGDLGALPVDDAAVDLVVCSLALTHLPELGPAFAEFARVVRPGGTVIVSDIHPLWVTFVGAAAVFPAASEGFELHFVRNLLHPVSEYVRTAIDAGLLIHECREPRSRMRRSPPTPPTRWCPVRCARRSKGSRSSSYGGSRAPGEL